MADHMATMPTVAKQQQAFGAQKPTAKSYYTEMKKDIFDQGTHTGMTENNEIKADELFPTSRRESEIGGKKFVVISHFVGNKDLNALMLNLAVKRANREMGI